MKTVLVTGGSGFIGSHTVDALAIRDYRVLAFDVYPRTFEPAPENVRLIQGNLNDQELIRRTIVDEGVEVIVHAAWASIHETSLKNPAADLQANVVPTLKLLETCRDSSVRRFIFLSSGGQVYGIPDEIPVPETHPTRPLSPYGAAKISAEKYIQMYGHLYGLETVIFRPSVPYGPRQNPRRRQGAVAVFTHRALHGLPVEIWGDGSTRRDYFHVDDLCRAMLAAVDRSEAVGKIFNLGGSRAYTLLELVNMVETVLNRRVEIRFNSARPFDVPDLQLDTGLATSKLDWQPEITLEDGIRDTAAWLSTWFDEE